MTLSSRKFLPPLLLSLGLVLITGSVILLLKKQPPAPAIPSTIPVKVDFPTPDLTLKDLQGAAHSLTDYRGQVVLVNLWATWCPPCKEEMPTLQAFYEEHRENGFTIIAINDGDAREAVVQFVRDYKLTFPVWLDPTYIATEDAFNTRSLPTSFVIGRGGRIQLMWIGGISAEMLDQHVTPLILEQ